MHAVAIIISISCLAFSAIAVVVKDDNAIVQLVFDNYYRSLNASGKLAGCTPVIVSGVPNGSVIRPFTGWRGNVALIVQSGSCKITDTFVCTVDWGDKSSEPTSTTLHGLLPCQLTNQYEKIDRSYTIHASYCYVPTTTSGDILPLICANYVRRIDTSYDPANPLNITTQGGP